MEGNGTAEVGRAGEASCGERRLHGEPIESGGWMR
jgi:hypothetical protein